MFDSLSHLTVGTTREAKTESKTESFFAMSNMANTANTAQPLVGFRVSPASDPTAYPVSRPASPSSSHPAANSSAHAASPGEPLGLTAAERAIALLIAEGARNHDIARQLGVSHRTVESHLSNIFAKLGIGSRVQLALWVSTSKQTEG
jgi:DNA-binding CsgD family transcriptional regulator